MVLARSTVSWVCFPLQARCGWEPASAGCHGTGAWERPDRCPVGAVAGLLRALLAASGAEQQAGSGRLALR